jgi:hypothetical protein
MCAAGETAEQQSSSRVESWRLPVNSALANTRALMLAQLHREGASRMKHTWTVLILALLGTVVAFAAGAFLRRRGAIRLDPVRYVPHLVFLCTVAAAPMLTRDGVGALRAASVFAGVAAIWLVALLLLSRMRM